MLVGPGAPKLKTHSRLLCLTNALAYKKSELLYCSLCICFPYGLTGDLAGAPFVLSQDRLLTPILHHKKTLTINVRVPCHCVTWLGLPSSWLRTGFSPQFYTIKNPDHKCQGSMSPCDLAGARTQDPLLKREMLYQLSYQVIICRFGRPARRSNTNGIA